MRARSNVFVSYGCNPFEEITTKNAENVVEASAFRESNATLLVEIQVAYVPDLSACSAAWRTRTGRCVFGFRTCLLARDTHEIFPVKSGKVGGKVSV